ncbi:hypothetical protein RCH23_003005 [Cryobacterium sp. CAN_C3]|uniref:WapI family immunity protein n=1 Tax=unclassified Cryobacterium TaxID=2649013 RepID=UPI0018CA46EF|nr:hypothetical protein [Cryobacterium sp. CAN_C3]MEC5155604.1 hypothetical protein [Cryobacterium sp. CAN_C3]
MELKDLSGPAQIVLHPVHDEFESVTGDDWDDNWLIMAGSVVSAENERWACRYPALVVDQAMEIAGWFERVATRLEALMEVGENGGIAPSLAFTEPNLGFSVQSYGEDTVVVRVHLSLEALPPDRRDPEADHITEHTFWIEIETTLTDAASAAATWRTELAAFPGR